VSALDHTLTIRTSLTNQDAESLQQLMAGLSSFIYNPQSESYGLTAIEVYADLDETLLARRKSLESKIEIFATAPQSLSGGSSTPVPTELPRPTVQASGRFVASGQARTYFYCVTDPAWKELKGDLFWTDDESFFIQRGLILHKPC